MESKIAVPERVRQALTKRRLEWVYDPTTIIAEENKNSNITAVAREVDFAWYLEFIQQDTIVARRRHLIDIIQYGTLADYKCIATLPKYKDEALLLRYSPWRDECDIKFAIDADKVDMVEYFVNASACFIESVVWREYCQAAKSPIMKWCVRALWAENLRACQNQYR